MNRFNGSEWLSLEGNVDEIIEDDDGDLWFSNAFGLLRFSDGKLIQHGSNLAKYEILGGLHPIARMAIDRIGNL